MANGATATALFGDSSRKVFYASLHLGTNKNNLKIINWVLGHGSF
jgi:hypothetical protein